MAFAVFQNRVFGLASLVEPASVERGVRVLDTWLDWGIKLGSVRVTVGSLIGSLLILAAFLLAASMLKRLLRRYVQRNANVNQSAAYTIERLLHYVMLTVGVLWALSIAGIPMAKMTVFAGALGVGLGFGMQAIFNNFVSGLILLFERSLKVGDFVELTSGVHGHVRDIYIRATRITTNDDIDILVPNSEFVNGQVVNWTLREVARRQKVPFGVAYGTDKELVKKAALEAAAAVPFTLSLEGQRAPQVWLVGFGDSSLDFQLVVWLNAEATRRPGAVTAAYYWALHTALEKYDIELPFPQRDLHIKSWVRPERARDSSTADDSHAGAERTSPSTDNDAARDVARDIAEESAQRADTSTHPHPGASR
jgi:small-conductance mechanosensitive channel